jgi:hypothetical protein
MRDNPPCDQPGLHGPHGVKVTVVVDHHTQDWGGVMEGSGSDLQVGNTDRTALPPREQPRPHLGQLGVSVRGPGPVSARHVGVECRDTHVSPSRQKSVTDT